MEHLTESQLATLRAKIEAELADIQARLGAEADELAATPTAEPGDVEDGAAADAGHFQAHSLRARDQTRRAELEAALARMNEGDYGICEDSDDEIPYRRLEAEPTTRYTVAAQELRERERGVSDPHANEPVGY